MIFNSRGSLTGCERWGAYCVVSVASSMARAVRCHLTLLVTRPAHHAPPSMTSTPAPPHTRPADVQTVFKHHFGYTPPHVVKAPGRLELLGNHTDYNEGLVMSVAVDRYIFIACGPRTDGRIELVSSAFPGPEKFWISEIRPNPAARWADY